MSTEPRTTANVTVIVEDICFVELLSSLGSTISRLPVLLLSMLILTSCTSTGNPDHAPTTTTEILLTSEHGDKLAPVGHLGACDFTVEEKYSHADEPDDPHPFLTLDRSATGT